MFTRSLALAATVIWLATIHAVAAEAQQQQTQQQTQQQQQQTGRGALATVALASELTAANVVVDTVKATGSAKGTFSLVQATKEFCYTLAFTGLTQLTSAEVRKAGAGENGPLIAALAIRADTTTSNGCTKLEDAHFNDIVANPMMYYVQVQTLAFPRGAIRGQLVKPPM